MINVLIITFCIAGLIQLAFLSRFLIGFLQLKISNSEQKSANGKDISIVICARNELANLQTHFQYWIQQKSNQELCQLIIVDDASTDESAVFLNNMAQKHPNFTLITIPIDAKKPGKKGALAAGISAVTGKYIVLTDADCQPSSQQWAAHMVNCLKNGDKKICLGYAPYYQQDNCVNYFVQYETTLTALLYFGFALSGMPYMGVGRNLAYTKDFYQQMGGLSNHPKNLSSGDDDMFVNQYATADNVGICLNTNAFCYSQAPQNFKNWLNQKKRHLSTSPFYKKKHQILLSLYALSHFLLIGTIFVFIFTPYFVYSVVFFLIRGLVLFYLFKKIFKQNSAKNVFIYVYIIDALHFFYYITLSFYTLLSSKNNWK